MLGGGKTLNRDAMCEGVPCSHIGSWGIWIVSGSFRGLHHVAREQWLTWLIIASRQPGPKELIKLAHAEWTVYVPASLQMCTQEEVHFSHSAHQ